MRHSVAAKASKEYSIAQQFPKKTLNNTTVNTLANTNEPLEVFPPEIFFKGKSEPKIQILGLAVSNFIRHRAAPELRSDSDYPEHQQESQTSQILAAQDF
jgi:hypothetical protein